MKYKKLFKKRSNAEFAEKRDCADFEKFGSKICLIFYSIVGLDNQTIQNKWIYIFLEKKQTYQNGIILSKIMKTKDQKLETLILKRDAY